MAKMELIPLSELIADVIEENDFGEFGFDEDLFYKWGNDAAKYIITDEQLCHQISLLEVDNYKADLPKDCKILCEVAFRKAPKNECGNKRERIVQYTQNVGNGEDCELEINVKCGACHKTTCEGCGGKESVIVDVDRIWEMSNSHFNYNSKFMRVSHFGKGSSVHTPEFKLLKPALSSWNGLQKVHLNNCMNFSCECDYTYNIKAPNIEVSFEKGELLFSYLGAEVDENGDLMIPNHPTSIDAITEAIIYKTFRKAYRSKAIRGSDSRDLYRAYKDAEVSYNRSIGAARSHNQIPSAKEFIQYINRSPERQNRDKYRRFLGDTNESRRGR